ncbi:MULTISPECIES: hypothetical protein [Haloferax]|uniref:Lipoprotein n=1 Tax=Haloferax marinum TaxID=2666143 RepID=A0A6A8G4Y3_9EURY|nr:MULTISPECIES: hypothetical protein [Haloferax]KAB1197252.1 hypothetical protein Hfx1150_06870 [Haloferax sp. CBA1150]MRW96290.1 hypothetical protein [Haloferax marinum]
MNRRAILAGVAGLCVSLAGCAADDGDADDEQTTTAKTTEPTPSFPVLVERSLSPESAENCPTEGQATIHTATDGVVPIDGCLWGPTGCSVLRLAAADYDTDSDTASVTTETVEDVSPDEACTQALVALGYRVELRFEYQLPRRVVVVHDDANGTRTVAEREI